MRRHRCRRTVRFLGRTWLLPAWLGRSTACLCHISTQGPVHVRGTGEEDDPYVLDLNPR